MEVRNEKIAEAAIAVVSRYGLRKTTMADLAQAAGVSRQTLYNAYENKEEVIRDAIRHVTAKGIEGVERDWSEQTHLGAKLESFFARGPLSWYDMIQSTPDAADLIDGLSKVGEVEMAEATERWIATITRLFAPYAEKLSSVGQSPDMLARFSYLTAHSAKSTAGTREDVLARLSTLKASVLALVGET